jgi:hypothetical protein
MPANCGVIHKSCFVTLVFTIAMFIITTVFFIINVVNPISLNHPYVCHVTITDDVCFSTSSNECVMLNIVTTLSDGSKFTKDMQMACFDYCSYYNNTDIKCNVVGNTVDLRTFNTANVITATFTCLFSVMLLCLLIIHILYIVGYSYDVAQFKSYFSNDLCPCI